MLTIIRLEVCLHHKENLTLYLACISIFDFQNLTNHKNTQDYISKFFKWNNKNEKYELKWCSLYSLIKSLYKGRLKVALYTNALCDRSIENHVKEMIIQKWHRYRISFFYLNFLFYLKLETSCKMYTGYLRAKNYKVNNKHYIIF